MKMMKLGATGLTVSAVCMGTVHYGSRMDDAASFAALDRFADHGGNFLDTARVYADWLPGNVPQSSEKCLGRWLKTRADRDHIVIATKGGHPPLGVPGRPTLRAEELRVQSDESRRNLGLDTLPIYYLHRDDPALPVEQIMDALFALQDGGVVRHIACSNWTAARIAQAQAYAARCNRAGFALVSNQWSLARIVPGSGDQTLVHTDGELVRFHEETQLPLAPFTSMAQGYLSKLAAGREIVPSLRALYGVSENDRLAACAAEIAEKRGATVAQICQSFFYAQKFPVIPIIAFSTDAQMDEAIAATDIALTAEEMRRLTR